LEAGIWYLAIGRFFKKILDIGVMMFLNEKELTNASTDKFVPLRRRSRGYPCFGHEKGSPERKKTAAKRFGKISIEDLYQEGPSIRCRQEPRRGAQSFGLCHPRISEGLAQESCPQEDRGPQNLSIDQESEHAGLPGLNFPFVFPPPSFEGYLLPIFGFNRNSGGG
jgi:hypothetical protein